MGSKMEGLTNIYNERMDGEADEIGRDGEIDNLEEKLW